MITKTKGFTIAGGLALLATAAGAYANIQTLKPILPITESNLEEFARELRLERAVLLNERFKITEALSKQSQESNEYWIEDFQQQQRDAEFEKEQWRLKNPGRSVPPVFDRQIDRLERRIQRLDNLNKFRAPAQ